MTECVDLLKSTQKTDLDDTTEESPMYTNTYTNMTRTNTRFNTSRPGFSLLELTAVLVILGLLAGAAAVAIPSQIEKARQRTTKTSMGTIKSQIESYRAENAGTAPASLTALIPSYMEDGAQLDSWDMPYYYAVTPGGQHEYELRSGGKDKQLNTDDDINLWTMNVTAAN